MRRRARRGRERHRERHGERGRPRESHGHRDRGHDAAGGRAASQCSCVRGPLGADRQSVAGLANRACIRGRRDPAGRVAFREETPGHDAARRPPRADTTRGQAGARACRPGSSRPRSRLFSSSGRTPSGPTRMRNPSRPSSSRRSPPKRAFPPASRRSCGCRSSRRAIRQWPRWRPPPTPPAPARSQLRCSPHNSPDSNGSRATRHRVVPTRSPRRAVRRARPSRWRARARCCARSRVGHRPAPNT